VWRQLDAPDLVHPGGTPITRRGTEMRWWTWAGYRANATLTASLAAVSDPVQRPTDCYVRLREDLTPAMWRVARQAVTPEGLLVLPDVDRRAVAGLKFSAALPERLAVATLAARLADFDGARSVLAEPVRLHITSGDAP
jgi:ATP-dependent Lhr-like helicase